MSDAGRHRPPELLGVVLREGRDPEAFRSLTWDIRAIEAVLHHPVARSVELPFRSVTGARLVGYYGRAATRKTMHHLPRPTLVIGMTAHDEVVSLTIRDLLKLATIHFIEASTPLGIAKLGSRAML